MKSAPKIRAYPSFCLSASCGKTCCDGCPNGPTLRAFKTWIAATDAKVLDPIWCPTIYTATKKG